MSVKAGPNWKPWLGPDDGPAWFHFRPIPQGAAEAIADGQAHAWWESDVGPDEVEIYMRVARRDKELVVTAVHVETVRRTVLTKGDLRLSLKRRLNMIRRALAAEFASGETDGIVRAATGHLPQASPLRRVGGSAPGAYRLPADELAALVERWRHVRPHAASRRQAEAALADELGVARTTVWRRLQRAANDDLISREELS